MNITNAIKNNTNPFFGSVDIGNVKHQGSYVYDEKTDEYFIKGSGSNIWSTNDEFYFLYTKTSRNIIIQACIDWIGQGKEPHRKSGIMIRKSLDPCSQFVCIANHGDGLISFQFRDVPNGQTSEIRFTDSLLSFIQLEKNNEEIIASTCLFGNDTNNIEKRKFDFINDSVYVGLFVCSHNPDVIESCKFYNVRLYSKIKENFIPYTDYIGSRLEYLNVIDGKRQIIYETTDAIEAPNVSKDDNYVVFNSKGLIYYFPLFENIGPQKINTNFATSNNNDHGLSPDGKFLAISHHDSKLKQGENSIIYILPVNGGIPIQVTAKGPSYWHSWSPDGKFLMYTAKRNGNWNIFRINIDSREEEQITYDNNCLNDGPDYSPDGKYIWYNSNRSGTMQIWRMKNDGTEQIQITDDKYQNWFPHPSPDGKMIVFLSYPPEIGEWDHPYYKNVTIKLLNLNTGTIKVIAYLYGGQGTMNVPCWTSDSKGMFFISNTDNLK